MALKPWPKSSSWARSMQVSNYGCEKFVSLKYLFWYSILLLCFTLTSWFGFVFGLVVAIYSFYRWQRDRYYAHFVGVTMLTPSCKHTLACTRKILSTRRDWFF